MHFSIDKQLWSLWIILKTNSFEKYVFLQIYCYDYLLSQPIIVMTLFYNLLISITCIIIYSQSNKDFKLQLTYGVL